MFNCVVHRGGGGEGGGGGGSHPFGNFVSLIARGLELVGPTMLFVRGSSVVSGPTIFLVPRRRQLLVCLVI